MNASSYTRAAALILIGLCLISLAKPPVFTPSEVIRLTYEAANAGRYEEAEKHLSAVAFKQIHGLAARLAGGHIKLWDGWTRNRTISRIEVLKEETRKGEVTVYYRFHFKDGSSKEDDDSLVLEDGEWKILP